MTDLADDRRVLRAFDTDRFELPLPPGHRFPMVKYRLLRERLEASTLPVRIAPPPAANDEQLCRVHDSDYIERVVECRLTPTELRRIGFPWTQLMVERSRRSSGATVAAARASLEDGVACNLAGGTHHANRRRGQGYCVFNDAAVAIETLRADGVITTAAVIDTDVHQGNGTAEIYADDPQVRTFSIHGEKNFPALKHASDVDIALPPGTSDDVYLAALEDGLSRFLEDCVPDLVIFTSGADPFVDDTLGSLALSKAGLRERDRHVLNVCRERRLPVAVTMAGGYSECVDDIVDIHFQTVATATEFLWKTSVTRPVAAALTSRSSVDAVDS